MLTERQTRILELIVSDYVERAVPVASQALGRNHQVGVSAATIRSEMAELEAQGYVNQPHTSAGRVPTEKGYRFYVEWLMHEETLSQEAQQTIRHQFHQIERGQERWTHLAASILAQTVENVAVVTSPHAAACHIKHLELVSLQDSTALLVLVLDQGRLQQQILRLEQPQTQDELSVLAARLNQRFGRSTVREVAAGEAVLTELERQIMDTVVEIMAAVDEGGFDEAYLEGLRHILGQPEFTDSDRVLDLLELLDEHNLTRTIPLRALAREGVTVIIGAEHPRLAEAGEAMRECSVIIGGYGAPGVASGALAVLGPMRMRYSHTISTVRYLADVMSELLSEYYE